jgi:hypothetical protein
VLLGVLLGVLLSRKGEGAGNRDYSSSSGGANTGIYSPDPADRPDSVN